MRLLLPTTAAAVLACAPLVAFGQESAGTPAATDASGAGIAIELNKLEQVEASCRAYFVVSNGTKQTIDELGLDVFVFDRQKVITRRVGLSFERVRPDRRKVVLFDLEATSCDDVAELMVNDILDCKVAGADKADCPAMISTSSLASASLAY